MQPVTIVLIYIIIWWILFFVVLPIGLKGRAVDAKTGAPKVPFLRRKASFVSLVALVVTAVVVGAFNLFGEQLYTWAQTGSWPN